AGWRPGGEEGRGAGAVGEGEGGPGPRHAVALDPHRTPHHFAEALADRQAETCAAILACGGAIHLAEGLEEVGYPLRRDADARVANGEVELVGPSRWRAGSDGGAGARGGANDVLRMDG